MQKLIGSAEVMKGVVALSAVSRDKRVVRHSGSDASNEVDGKDAVALSAVPRESDGSRVSNEVDGRRHTKGPVGISAGLSQRSVERLLAMAYGEPRIAGPSSRNLYQLLVVLVVGSLFACPQKTKQIKTVIANPSSGPATTQPLEDEEIGLLSVQIAPISEQVACVYGGWTCLSGEQFSLLRCTSDGGKTFTEAAPAAECSYIKDYQLSRDGNTIWFSCEAKTGASHIVRSTDRAQTFSLSEPITPRGELLAWAFSSSKNGLAVIAAEGELAERDVVYIEKSTSDAGATWKPLLEIKGEFAAQFNPELEVNRKPPPEIASPLRLQKIAGPDGGPAYQVNNTEKQMLSLAWRDIPGKCSPATLLPPDELFPGFGPLGPEVKQK